MICASCGQDNAAETGPCSNCGEDPTLDGRYQLLGIIGQGGAGVTYRARRLSDRDIVCVKELAYNRLADFDAQKMFEREAQVLRQLAHPGIPSYVDHFTAGEGKALSLYLVQEYVQGHTLQEEMDAYRYDEYQVLDILEELTGILEYLGNLRPAVVHRDIKPANIIRRQEDYRLMLVDFGSVKATTQSEGQTIVGTAGYMAPEQTWGTATPSSDYYALGVVGIVLLSRREPHELLDTSHSLRWEAHVECAPTARRLFEKLLHADPSARPASTRVIRQAIRRAKYEVEQGYSAQSGAHGRASVGADTTSGTGAQASMEESGNLPIRIILVSVSLGLVIMLAAVMILIMQSTDERVVERVATTETTVETTDSPDSPAEPAVESEPICPSGACASYDEPFKQGLSFGMSASELSEALPDADSEGWRSGRKVSHRQARGDETHAAPLPGEYLAVDMKTAGEASTCHFYNAVDDGLSAIECRLKPLKSLSSHRAAQNRIKRRLTERYGAPTDTNAGTVAEGGDFKEDYGAYWESGEGRLEFRSRFRRVGSEVRTSEMTILQSTPAHQEVVERVRSESLESFEEHQKELKAEPL